MCRFDNLVITQWALGRTTGTNELNTSRLSLVSHLCVVPVDSYKHVLFFNLTEPVGSFNKTDDRCEVCLLLQGLLLNFKPEVFSALKVYPLEKTDEEPGEEAEPSVNPAAADRAQSNNPSSTQSSDCRSTTSVSTEELELSALLSRSSSDTEETPQSTSPSPINILQLGDGHTPQPEHSCEGNQAEVFGVSQQEEAYVTMSSFYQIK